MKKFDKAIQLMLENAVQPIQVVYTYEPLEQLRIDAKHFVKHSNIQPEDKIFTEYCLSICWFEENGKIENTGSYQQKEHVYVQDCVVRQIIPNNRTFKYGASLLPSTSFGSGDEGYHFFWDGSGVEHSSLQDAFDSIEVWLANNYCDEISQPEVLKPIFNNISKTIKNVLPLLFDKQQVKIVSYFGEEKTSEDAKEVVCAILFRSLSDTILDSAKNITQDAEDDISNW